MWVSRVRVSVRSRPDQRRSISSSRGAHLARRGEQEGEEVELPARQVDDAGGHPDLAAGEVDPYRSGHHHFLGDTRVGRQALGPGHRRRLHPPEDGLDAGHQLAETVGLGHVVGRPQLQAEDDIHLGVEGRDHDHRHRSQGPHASAHLGPRQTGEHDVEEDEVGRVGGELPQALEAVGGQLDGETLVAQAGLEGFAVGLLVFDHQDPYPSVDAPRHGRGDHVGARPTRWRRSGE